MATARAVTACAHPFLLVLQARKTAMEHIRTADPLAFHEKARPRNHPLALFRPRSPLQSLRSAVPMVSAVPCAVSEGTQ
jgi:hypothetical protein